MTIPHILKKSFTISTTQMGLWTLGIFLSSGFNLHWWYFLSWLKRVGIVDQVVDNLTARQVANTDQLLFLLGFATIFLISLLIFNFIKLLFFGKVHQSLHNSQYQKCFLCKRIYLEQKSLTTLSTRKLILWRSCLASLITIGSTVITLIGFMYFFNQMDSISFGSIMLLVCLVLILVGISLWNMLTVLFLFWYELSFTKASNLAMDILFGNAKRVIGLTAVLTLIFLVAVSIGSLIIRQLPVLFTALPNVWANLVIGKNIAHTAQAIISTLAGLLFLAWLVINNIFFNVAMIIGFDQLISGLGIKDGFAERVTLPSNPAILHHSRLPKEVVK